MMIFTKDNFEAEVLQSDKPVVVEFGAPWCGYCRILEPVVAEIAQECGEAVKFGSLDIDQATEIAIKYGIMSVPLCAKFENGELVAQVLGAVPKEQLVAGLEL